MTTLAEDATEYIEFLTGAGLLTGEHRLAVGLLRGLVEQLDKTTNATQYAAISKEIRATMEQLPKPEVKQTDELEDLLGELEALSADG